jgi:DNA polymerase
MTASADPLRRAVLQQLEVLQLSGLTHWKSIAPLPAAAPPVGESRPRAAPRPSGNTPMPRATLFREEPPAAAASAPRYQTFVPLNLSPEERRTRLAEWKERVAQCKRCQELAATRTQTVFGCGNPEARLLFVGEAPGAEEDAQGEPFVGKAGQLLNDIIKACRMKRDDVYICNVLRCRPPGNRVPTQQEAANCREYLDAQIAIVNPDYIVCWGSTAAKNLLESEESIGKMRGKFYRYGRAKVLCTYHPSYLLRNPAAKRDVWEDMKFLFRDMGIDLTAK